MNYTTLEEAIKDHQSLGKHDYAIVNVNGESIMLCGTPLVTEDLFYNTGCKAIAFIGSYLFFKDEDWHDVFDDGDVASELRDNLIEAFEKHYHLRIEYISTEY